jgi:ABC-type uncharacterized transport system substrate-binding protein
MSRSVNCPTARADAPRDRPRGGRGWRVSWPATLALFLMGAAPASAHPHVWVTVKSKLVYGPGGLATGVRHAWTFDDMFSAFATQGLEAKVKGAFTREELKDLADINVSSLKEFDYFTYAKADGRKTPFVDPVDYWLDYAGGVLTLHFTLPFKAPVKAKTLELDIYDPTIFVDFAFAPKDPAELDGAPGPCKLMVVRAGDKAVAQKPGEAFFNALTPDSSYGAQFANKIVVRCP